jgi:hypothetical protein
MPQLIDLSDDAFSDLKAWVPATGGIVFMKDLALAIGAERNVPDPKKGGNRTFFGRNDVLEVRFANSRLILLRHKFLTARAFGDRRGAAWAS